MEIEKVPAKIDMLHGSLWDKLPRFALPVAATAILEQLFNASDIAIVGNFSSGDKTVAVAAVGANSPLIGLILNLFIGIALGANRDGGAGRGIPRLEMPAPAGEGGEQCESSVTRSA